MEKPSFWIISIGAGVLMGVVGGALHVPFPLYLPFYVIGALQMEILDRMFGDAS